MEHPSWFLFYVFKYLNTSYYQAERNLLYVVTVERYAKPKAFTGV